MPDLIPISFDSLLGYSSTANVESQLGGVSTDPSINSRITAIGKRLSAKTENKSLPYQFKALNTNTINAFALPGGPTYVTVGLLNGLNPTDDELAAVMGHELGHVNARHGVKAMELSLGANFVTELVKSQLKKSQGLGLDNNDINRIDKYNKTVAGFISLGYGRDNEYTADAKGLDYMTAAGYNPYAMVSLMTKLQALEGRKTTNLEEFFSTHPSTTKRIGEINDIIETNYPAAKPMVAPLPSQAQSQAPASAPNTTSLLKPIILWPAIGLGAAILSYGVYRIFRKPPARPNGHSGRQIAQITQIRGNPRVPVALMPLIKEAGKYDHHGFWEAVKSGRFNKFRKELDMAYEKYGSIDEIYNLSKLINPTSNPNHLISNPIPEFHNTEEAIAYGKSISGNKEKINELFISRNQLIDIVNRIKYEPNVDWQMYSRLTGQLSFNREALEAAGMQRANPNRRLKNPSAGKLLLATIIPGIPPL